MARVGLSFSDRSEISTASKAGWSVRRIARHLGRCPSVISRELHRNSTKTRGYQAVTADVRAQRRRARPQQRKVAGDPVLQARVEADLAASWTPNEIAGRLRLEATDPTVERMANSPDARGQTVSGEAIYQYIYAIPKGELARKGIFLQSKRTKRRPRTTGRTRGGPIVGMVPIAERGEDAAQRRVPGHWEGDLIIGTGRSAIGTIVERRSRATLLVHLPRQQGWGEQPPVKNGPALGGYGAIAMNAGLTASIAALPQQLRKTLTWDRGKELSAHAQFAMDTGTQVFFADPHSPWQRPSNENTNGVLRQYFPKGTDLSRWSAEDLEAIAYTLNNRPRKVLGWKTPAEVFGEQLHSLQQPSVASTD